MKRYSNSCKFSFSETSSIKENNIMTLVDNFVGRWSFIIFTIRLTNTIVPSNLDFVIKYNLIHTTVDHELLHLSPLNYNHFIVLSLFSFPLIKQKNIALGKVTYCDFFILKKIECNSIC